MRCFVKTDSTVSCMKLAFLEAPVCKGSPTDGSQYAFASLCQHGLAARYPDAKLLPMTIPSFCDTPIDTPKTKDLNEVMAISRLLAETVSKNLRKGYLPVTVGGDHSIAIGTIAGVSEVYDTEKISVIYIDGHTDINNEETTETGFIHGMPLAAAMGCCGDALTVGKKKNLLGKNTVIVGARSIDRGEYRIIDEQGVKLYTADEVKERGVEAVWNEILARITTPYIHVSFDVDVMDEKVFSATGYRMKNGLSREETEALLRACFATGRVTSLDCVEYNPLLDADGTCRKTLFSLLDAAFSSVPNE